MLEFNCGLAFGK